jgi:methionyl-tRNA formyltransferase
MNVLLIGEESAGIQMLRELKRGGHRIVAVMASSSRDAALGASLWEVAQEEGFPAWPAQLVKDPTLAKRIRSEQVDIVLNVHSLYIIHKNVVEAPRIGAFNLHPGPLPRYAGLNPVSWAIYRGERSHGVTVHWMAAGIDVGPIAYQTIFSIGEDETALSLIARCAREGLVLLKRLLDVAARDPEAIPSIPQDLQKREYFGAGVPKCGRLSWARTAHEVVDFVRACDYYPFRSPWGHPRTCLGTQELSVVKALRTHRRSDAPPGTVGRFSGRGVEVASADEWVLVTKIAVANKFVDPTPTLKGGDKLADCEAL